MRSLADAWNHGDVESRLLLMLQAGLTLLVFFTTTWGFMDLMEVDIVGDIQQGTLDADSIAAFLLTFFIAAAVVATLLFCLTAMLDRTRNVPLRALAGAGFLFFAFWSCTFSYGFFWKQFAAEDFTRQQFVKQLEEMTEKVDVTTSMLANVVDAVAATAGAANHQEALSGGACENAGASAGGVGPFARALQIGASEANLTSENVRNRWYAPLSKLAISVRWRLDAVGPRGEFVRLNAEETSREDLETLYRLQRLANGDPNSRRRAYNEVLDFTNQFLATANRLRATVGSDARLSLDLLARNFSELMGRDANAWCKSSSIERASENAIAAIDAIDEVPPIQFENCEGARATRCASFNLANHVYLATSRLAGVVPANAPKPWPLTSGDFVALFASSAVALGLLLISIFARAYQRQPPQATTGLNAGSADAPANQSNAPISKSRAALFGGKPKPREAIFICYRREDTADVAGRIFDVLEPKFGRERIFKDVDNLRPGSDFGEYIQTVLPRCKVALVLIGPAWITAADEDGRRRLDDPNDWVRLEIETALASADLDVVPVLINGARMPRAEELPASLQALLRRHAATIRRDPDFRDDITRLASVLRASIRTGFLDLRQMGGDRNRN